MPYMKPFKKSRSLAFMSLFLFGYNGVYAQDTLPKKVITGVVRDDAGMALPGVSIFTRDSSVFANTNVDGKFSITVPEKAHNLNFSFVGKKNQIINIDTVNSPLNISLLPFNDATLGDVIVVGYGSAKKSSISSSIASISEKDIKNLPLAGVDQMLQGKVAGVTVTSNSGQPGGGVSVRVRGITSVTGSNQPLYVVDGVPLMEGTSSTSQDGLGGVSGQTVQSPLATLNPSDIESIEILKDASAQAIYGSLGANGVVLITTKKGTAGKGKVSYSGYWGIAQRYRSLKLMNLKQYADYYNSVVAEGTVPGLISIPEFSKPELLGEGTNWQNAIFQTGNTQNHQLSFSGGSGKTTYFFSGNYYDQTGIVVGSAFKRYSMRANINQEIGKWLKAGISSNMSRTRQRVTLTDGQNSVIDLMMYNSPATAVKDANGQYLTTSNVAGVALGNTINPVALALLRKVYTDQTKAYGNAFVEAKILNGLTFKNQFNYDLQFNDNSAFQPEEFNDYGIQYIGPSRLTLAKNNSYYWSLQDYLTYNHNFGIHYLNVVAGHEASASHWDNQTISAYDLTDNLETTNAGTLDKSQTIAQSGSWAMESYFARATYSYSNRYSLSASYRRDGSSNFGPNRRWGTFKAISGAWNISNEKFAEQWKGKVDKFKLRVGYGETGDQSGLGNGLYGTNIRMVTAINGLFGQSSIAGVPANVGNPNLSWASIKTYNAGIDIGLLDNKLNITMDVYKKITTNMILPTILPSFAGLDPNPPNLSYKEIEPPYTNAGRMTNTGIDLTINTTNIETKNFSWNTTVIFSHYKNVLDALTVPGASLIGKSMDFSPVALTLTKSGGSVGQFYGFVTDGLYRTMDELQNGPQMPLGVGEHQTWLGDIRYKDLNGDNKINSSDQTYIGNPNPKFTYSLTNKFTYKGLDLSIFLNGVYGDKIYNYSRSKTEADYNVYVNQMTSVMDRYTASNPNGSLPRYNQWNGNNLYISNRFIESGSYLRIQNVSLGYTIPKRYLGKTFSSVRLYVTGQNLYTFTKYTGYDPEIGSYNNSVLTSNIDYGHYPNPRTITFGANIEL